MATIKIRRGSGQPAIGGSGLTAYEPAWDTVNNRFFINNGSTAMWIGAAVIQDTTLSGNCTWTIPTQNSVKTYVDNQVAAGAVTSVNGATGAVTIGGGTGISILTSTSARGVTIFNAGVLSINGNTGAISNVAFTNVAQTFTQLQTFSAGISASSGAVITGLATLFNDLDLKGGLTVGGSARFTSATSFNSGVSLINGPLSINGTIRNDSGTGITFSTGIRVSEDSTFSKNLAVSGALNVTGGGTFGSLYVVGPAAIDGAVTLLGGFDAKGATFGNLVRFVSGISANGGMTLAGSLQAAAATFSGLVTSNSGLVVNGGVTFNGNIYAPNLVTSVDGVTGAVDLLAGSGISITLPTGAAKGITLANTGVVGITGTANQVTVSGTSGSVTLSLPSAITTPGSLTTTTSLLVGTDATISGNLTVNGTTTTVNSTTVTVQDPLIAIGGYTGNAPAGLTGDVKDRGIVFQWNNGTSGLTGFFGLDQSKGRFTFLPRGVTVSGEIVTGTAGNAEFSGVFAPQGILTLSATNTSSPNITITSDAADANTKIEFNAARNIFLGQGVSVPTIELEGNGTSNFSIISSGVAGVVNRTFTLPDITGTAVVADAMGATTGWLLRGTGATTVPTWINPNAAGFTAYTASGVQLTATKAGSEFGLVFAQGNSGYQILYGDQATDIKWAPATNTLTLGGGNGKLEGVVDGGAF